MLATLTLDGLWGGLVTSGNRLYVGSGHVFDVSDPTAPKQVGMIPGWTALRPFGAYFVRVGGDAISVLDLSDVAAPRVLGSFSEPSFNDVAVSGSRAFAVHTTGFADQESVVIVDLGDVTAPKKLGELPLPNAVFLAADGDLAYVGAITGPLASADEQGLFVVDAHDPGSAKVIGHAAERNWGPYAVTGTQLLSVDHLIDVSNPRSPRIAGRPPLDGDGGSAPFGLTVAATGTLGIWGTNGGVYLVDLACPK